MPKGTGPAAYVEVLWLEDRGVRGDGDGNHVVEGEVEDEAGWRGRYIQCTALGGKGARRIPP